MDPPRVPYADGGAVVRVLVACEASGRVRDAFIRRGHDAVSCDILPAPGPHIQGDARPHLRRRWDLVVAHPPCTRLCLSGVRWLHERRLWGDLGRAAAFFRDCLAANAPRVAVENPQMHGYALALVGGGPAAWSQPWEHGDGETKRTGWWLRGLLPLAPSDPVAGREARVHRMAPGARRGLDRSITPLGTADAMAEQWGGWA